MDYYIDITKIVDALISRAWIIITISIAATIVSFNVVSDIYPDQYLATTTI